jgi:hypothetical protein
VSDDLTDKLNRVLKYSADHSTVENMLHQLGQPEHLLTRIGHPSRTDFRGVLSDALRDHGRDQEADLLHQGGHVVVHDGKVKPGRFTWEHLQHAMSRADHELFNPNVMERGPYRTTLETGPSIDWIPADDADPDAVEEEMYQPHIDDSNRPVVHHNKDGIPHVGITDDTCNTEDVPITKAADRYRNTVLNEQLGWIGDMDHNPATPEHLESLRTHPLVEAVSKAPIEEPVPDKGAS